MVRNLRGSIDDEHIGVEEQQLATDDIAGSRSNHRHRVVNACKWER